LKDERPPSCGAELIASAHAVGPTGHPLEGPLVPDFRAKEEASMAQNPGDYPTQPVGYQAPPPEHPGRDPLVLALAGIALAAAIGAIIIGLVALGQDNGGGGTSSAVTVGTDNIEDGAVTEPKLSDGAVSERTLAEGAVGQAALAQGSVSEQSLADTAVTGAKLADTAVKSRAIAGGAVTEAKLADGAVTAKKVAPDSITGANVAEDSLGGREIDESTLGEVPLAAEAEVARSVDLGNLVPQVQTVDAQSGSDASPSKGPVEASCPSGTRVFAGGAEVVSEGAEAPVALTTSVPTATGWSASALAFADSTTSWSLHVVAVCASVSG
jgi:hypothetical protein